MIGTVPASSAPFDNATTKLGVTVPASANLDAKEIATIEIAIKAT